MKRIRNLLNKTQRTLMNGIKIVLPTVTLSLSLPSVEDTPKVIVNHAEEQYAKNFVQEKVEDVVYKLEDILRPEIHKPIISNYHVIMNHFNLMYNTSLQKNIDPYIIALLIYKESRWKQNAVSKKHGRTLAYGYGQLSNIAAKHIGLSKKDIYAPDKNIIGSIEYFDILLKMFNDDIFLALAAYNAGPNNIIKAIEKTKRKHPGKDNISWNDISKELGYKETINYVKDIASKHSQLIKSNYSKQDGKKYSFN